MRAKMRKRRPTNRPRKKLSGLDKYCIFTISFFTIYTIAELAISAITGVTNDRLTEAVQWFCAGELFLLAMIKRLKLQKTKEDKEDMEE